MRSDPVSYWSWGKAFVACVVVNENATGFSTLRSVACELVATVVESSSNSIGSAIVVVAEDSNVHCWACRYRHRVSPTTGKAIFDVVAVTFFGDGREPLVAHVPAAFETSD